MIQNLIEKYQEFEKDKIHPISDWSRNELFERLISYFLNILGYNPDQISYDEKKGIVKLNVKEDTKLILFISSLQEKEKFKSNKLTAPIKTIVNPLTGKSEYEIAVVTNFETWFFYFEGKEVYAFTIERLEKEYETIRQLISRESIETGNSKEFIRKLLYKEDNEPLRSELNILREKIANKILQEKINLHHLKNPDGTFKNELINEITTRWITRFLALKLAEDYGIIFSYTLKDIRRSFELSGKVAKPIPDAKVKEETLSNAIRALMNEFERNYNGGIFMYKEGVDYITIPDSAFFDLLDFATSWAFPKEDARIIGYVYERFLGQEIIIEEINGKAQAVLKNVSEVRSKRKSSGIYYTPKVIVDYIVENSLGEIFNEKRKELDEALENLDCEKFALLIKEVKNLKVLDPACGSGSFLIKVLAEFRSFYSDVLFKVKELKEKIAKLKNEKTKGIKLFSEDSDLNLLLKKYQEVEDEINELRYPGIFALRNNIYGVDLDPKAIDIAAFTLMVQVYDELKEGARCPTMIGENLKTGNSLVTSIFYDSSNNFVSRNDLERFSNEISRLILLRNEERNLDNLGDFEIRKLIEENFDELLNIYVEIKEKYPNAIPTHQQKLLEEWHRKAKEEPKEKTFDILINQTGIARFLLREIFRKKIEATKDVIELEINKPLIKYFNSKKKVISDRKFAELIKNEKKLMQELNLIKTNPAEISKNQPIRVFNWEIEFPEVFFNNDGKQKDTAGFDCIVGNPPWGRLKEFEDKSEKEILSKYFRDGTYKLQKGNINLYKLFIERTYTLLKGSGLSSMIIPSAFLGEDQSSLLRIELFEKNTVKSILQFSVPAIEELFGKQLIMDATIFTYEKTPKNDYVFSVKTEITAKEARNLKGIKTIKIKCSDLKRLSETYQIPIFRDMEKELAILEKIDKNPKFGTLFEGKPILKIGVGQLDETEHKNFMSTEPTGDLLIRGSHIKRYFVDLSPSGEQPRWVKKKDFLISKPSVEKFLSLSSPVILGRQMVNRQEKRKLHFSALKNRFVMSNGVRWITIENDNFDILFILGLLNSSLLDWRFALFSSTFNVKPYEINSLPFVPAGRELQKPIINLVRKIIKKNEEYYSISKELGDYVNLLDCSYVNIEQFIKTFTQDFVIESFSETQTGNFDYLRARIEKERFFIEYGIKEKPQSHKTNTNKAETSKNKNSVNWFIAGSGIPKDGDAVEFLSEYLKKKIKFSYSKNKSIWEKIAEVEVPKFDENVRDGFLKYKSSIRHANLLEEEILKIDRAIDSLVYDLYSLTKEEILVIEKIVWEEKFEEMYKKLPPKEDALKLSEQLKDI